MRISTIAAAGVIALTLSANRAAAQPGGGAGSSASPAAGSTFPWEAGLQVSTWGTVNLFNGNLLVRIPIVSWTANVFDPDFALYHNSAAAESSLPVPGTAGFSLGPGWRIGYGGQLWFEDADTTWVIEDDGLMIEYTKVAGVWVPPTGVYDALTYDATADEWTLTRKNQWRRIYEPIGDPPTAARLVRQTGSEVDLTGGVENSPALLVNYETGGTQRVDSIDGPNQWGHRHLYFKYFPGPNGKLEKITEGKLDDRTYWFFYDGSDRVDHVEMTKSGSHVWDVYVGYDASDRITSLTDKEGKTYTFDYDAQGHLKTVIDPLTNTQSFVYNGSVGPVIWTTNYTDRRAKVWRYTFNSFGGLIKIKDPLTKLVQFSYDADRNRTDFTNELSKTWLATYDAGGNMLTISDPLGHKWTWTYDLYNNVTSITPPLDNLGGADVNKTVTYEYNDVDPDEPQRYNRTNVTKITEPADGEANPAAVTMLEYFHDPSTLTLSKKGKLRKVKDANGVITLFDYDSARSWLASIQEGVYDPDEPNNPVNWTYVGDGVGRGTNATGYNGFIERAYDGNDNPTTARCVPCAIDDGCDDEDPPPDDHIPILDCCDAIVAPACGLLNCTTYDYDNMNNLRSATREFQRTWEIVSGPDVMEFGIRSVSNTLDALYRLTSQEITSTEPTTNPPNYDPGVIRTLDYEYDENSNLTKITDDDDNVTDYTYDDANRLTNVKLNGTNVVTYTLYDTGRVQYADYENGVRTEWVYDDAQRLDKIRHTKAAALLLELDFAYDPPGLITSIDQSDDTDSALVTYTYDRRERLLREWGDVLVPGATPATVAVDLTYTYDQLGNRLTKLDATTTPATVTTYTYDVQNQALYQSFHNRLMEYEVKQDATLLEETWYAYNAGGHVQRIVTKYPGDDTYYIRCFSYTIDQNLWLVELKTAEVGGNRNPINVATQLLREFRYDDDRRRYLTRDRQPQVGGGNYFTPIAGSAVWHEFVGDSIHSDLDIDPVSGVVNLLATYTHRGSRRGVEDGGLIGTYDTAQRYFHANHLGSTRFVSESAGTAAAAVGYSAFGEVLGTNGSNLPRYGYAGAWGYQNDGLADPPHEIGLLHVGARYYDPASGRFTQRDPIGIGGGLNGFAYLRGTPTLGVDPGGLNPALIIAEIDSVTQDLVRQYIMVNFYVTGNMFKEAIHAYVRMQKLQHVHRLLCSLLTRM